MSGRIERVKWRIVLVGDAKLVGGNVALVWTPLQAFRYIELANRVDETFILFSTFT